MNNILAIASIVIKELYRRKDFYVLFILSVLITLVMGSLNLFNDDKIVRYLKEICLLLIWISSLVIAIGTAARQIPSERDNRTIFPLLAKPVTRGQLLVGKFLGCWLACGIALLSFYLFFGLVCAAREHMFLGANYLQAMWLQWMLLAIVISLTLLGSIVLTPAANMTVVFIVSAGILLGGRHLNKVALQMSEPGSTVLYVIYYLIPHMEFFDVRDLIIHNAERIGWSIFGFVSVYAAAYTGFFLLASWLLFRRRALN